MFFSVFFKKERNLVSFKKLKELFFKKEPKKLGGLFFFKKTGFSQPCDKYITTLKTLNGPQRARS